MADGGAAPSAALTGRASQRAGAASALREAGIAFLIAMALFGSLVGLRTEGGSLRFPRISRWRWL